MNERTKEPMCQRYQLEDICSDQRFETLNFHTSVSFGLVPFSDR